MTVRIERATVGDWARVRAVRLRALETDPGAFSPFADQERARPPEVWRGRLTDPSMAYFLAVETGARGPADVGLARLGVSRREGAEGGAGENEFAGLYGLWVAPECRGMGAGRALVGAVAAEAAARGFDALYLEVVDTNAAAVALYERCGFVATGRKSAMPPPREHVTEHERVLRLRRD